MKLWDVSVIMDHLPSSLNLHFSQFLLLLLTDVMSDFGAVQYKGLQGQLLVMFTSVGQTL